MAKTKLQKSEILRNITEKINKAKSVVFTQFNAMKVKESEDLRNKLKKENSELYVAKKTLLELAFKNAGNTGLNIKNLGERIAVIFGYGDEIAPAKVVDQFKKENIDKVNFVGGILNNKFLSADEVDVLAKLPGKQELYAQIVGSIKAPVSGFVNVLSGNLRKLVYVLKAIEDKK